MNSRRPLPQPARAILGTTGLLLRWGLLPHPFKALERPHDVRIKRGHPRWLAGRVDTGIRTWDDTVGGRGGGIDVRVYAREDLKPGTPGVLVIHGGGFSDGGLEFTDHVARGLARQTGYVVVGLSYRLAPEHPFPAALEDCQDVLHWMVARRPQGMDPTRLAVLGESAGGNLAAALVIANRDGARLPVLHQTIVYPFTDTTLSSTDWDTSSMAGVGRPQGEQMVEMYAGTNRDNPLVSVLHADLAGLPPAMVVSCEHDPLKSDGIWYAERLAAAGGDVHHRHYDNLPHGYLVMPGIVREAKQSLDEIALEMVKRLGPSQAQSTDW